jgi:hypothetical protein
MTKQEKINEIINFLDNSEDIGNACIERLDDLNGYLNGERYHNMSELQKLYGANVQELLNNVYFGHDEDNGAPFNPGRDYFKHGKNGVLISSPIKNYTIDENLVNEIVKHQEELHYIIYDTDLEFLIDELEELNK